MSQKDITHEIAAWVRVNGVPLAVSPDAQDGTDLQRLKSVLKTARVVGFGEATHGTREFFQIRHRIFRYLVSELGFTTLVIEASYSAAEALNEFVLNRRGELPDDVLTNLGFIMWDIQEFADTLQWMRCHNLSVAEESHKVRLCGMDICNTRDGRERVLRFVRENLQTHTSEVGALFEELAAAEADGLRAHERLNRKHLEKLESLWHQLEDVAKSSPCDAEVSGIARHARVIGQWVCANLPDELPPEYPRVQALNNFARSRFMGENLVYILERGGPESKVVVWAHNFHLGVGFEDAEHRIIPNMGAFLREKLGEAYYVFALELDRGACLTRVYLREQQAFGTFRDCELPSAPEHSIPWFLTQVGQSALFLNLRGVHKDQAVSRWFSEPQLMHQVAWAYYEPPSLYTHLVVPARYDGIVFVKETSPTTPTRAAREIVTAGKGH